VQPLSSALAQKERKKKEKNIDRQEKSINY
jgi:hypothetical protein